MHQIGKDKKIKIHDLAVVGLMAAMVFVCTAFLKVGPITTPAGPTQLKTGNAICLLAGLLFGGWRGGLAAGIGSALFDLTEPAFAPSAPFTLVFFFLMGFICGHLSHIGGRSGCYNAWNILSAAAGALSYMILHLGKSIFTLVLAGSTLSAALAANISKTITSGINAIFGVVVACLLTPILRTALKQAGIYKKFGRD